MSALIIFVYRHRHRLDLTKILTDIEHKRYWSGAIHAIAGKCIPILICINNVLLTLFLFIFSIQSCGKLMGTSTTAMM